ncbi:hypothetical protein ACFO0M_00655 [Micromonospora mangrovi]|uniref:Uncharacterized protein n=1 Tax=Micromonospora mangrovi TaxID=1182597 RepID=A0ABV8M3V1_9ACTN
MTLLKSYLVGRKISGMSGEPLLTSRRVVDLMRVASQLCCGPR